MSVPENIRKVPRPVNTIVEDNGRETLIVTLSVKGTASNMLQAETPNPVMER